MIDIIKMLPMMPLEGSQLLTLTTVIRFYINAVISLYLSIRDVFHSGVQQTATVTPWLAKHINVHEKQ